MFVFARALTYATLFLALVLVVLPARVLEWSGIRAPPAMGAVQVGGLVIGVIGVSVAIWCVLAFATVGRGTPAPFDPPRRLVVRGPYRLVRNPMYIGAALALTGTALYYQSLSLVVFLAIFVLTTHLFIIWYEEPTLARTFGDEYAEYRAHVHRWLPHFVRGGAPTG